MNALAKGIRFIGNGCKWLAAGISQCASKLFSRKVDASKATVARARASEQSSNWQKFSSGLSSSRGVISRLVSAFLPARQSANADKVIPANPEEMKKDTEMIDKPNVPISKPSQKLLEGLKKESLKLFESEKSLELFENPKAAHKEFWDSEDSEEIRHAGKTGRNEESLTTEKLKACINLFLNRKKEMSPEHMLAYIKEIEHYDNVALSAYLDHLESKSRNLSERLPEDLRSQYEETLAKKELSKSDLNSLDELHRTLLEKEQGLRGTDLEKPEFISVQTCRVKTEQFIRHKVVQLAMSDKIPCPELLRGVRASFIDFRDNRGDNTFVKLRKDAWELLTKDFEREGLFELMKFIRKELLEPNSFASSRGFIIDWGRAEDGLLPLLTEVRLAELIEKFNSSQPESADNRNA